MNSQTKFNEMTRFDKLPKEIQERMLECQEEQGNPRNADVFREYFNETKDNGGFSWSRTKEDHEFWAKVLEKNNHALFFQKYPKKRPIKEACKCIKNDFAKANELIQAWAKENNCTVEIIIKSN